MDAIGTARSVGAPGAQRETSEERGRSPLDPGKLEGIENLIPATIDEAKSYYHGVRAFDDGQYPEALAHYLDAARDAGDFRKAHPAVLEMYYLLGRSEHAVLFARELARSYEARGDVPGAAGVLLCGRPRMSGSAERPAIGARRCCKSSCSLVEQHERKTGEIAKTRRVHPGQDR